MTDITPNWSDYQSILTAQALTRGSRAAGSIDLRAKFGAYAFIRVGRQSNTALTNGIGVYIQRIMNDGSDDIYHPGNYYENYALGNTTALSASTIAADAAKGGLAIVVASATSLAANDLIMISDASRARLEFNRVTKVASTTISLATPLLFAHTSVQADVVTNSASVYSPVWLDGGSKYAIILDYVDDAAGSDAHIDVYAQVYNKDVTT